MKKWIIAASAVAMSLLLAGCVSGTLGKTYVQNHVDQAFDGAEFVRKGDSERKADSRRWEYIFSYKDIEFTVAETQDAIFDLGLVNIWDAHLYSSDYGEHLREFLSEEKLAEMSGGALDESKLWIDPNETGNTVAISYRMASIDELPAVVQAYKDIYDAVWEYLPEGNCGKDAGVTSLLPRVFLWLSVPSDDEGNYNLPADDIHHWESGYIPVMSFCTKSDIVDWEEVETVVRCKYYTVNDFMAEKGIKSPIEMSDEDKELIGRNSTSFYPVYYSYASHLSPTIDQMTKDIPKYER